MGKSLARAIGVKARNGPISIEFQSTSRPLNPDAAVEFWDGCTRERYLSPSKPYSLAPMMGERGGGVRGGKKTDGGPACSPH